jgi:amino acid transporter
MKKGYLIPDTPAMAVIKDVLGWIVVTALAFAYWLVMLLFASLVLLSYWNVTFDSLVQYSVVLTVVTSLLYLVFLIRRRRKERAIAKYMAE